MLNDPQRFVDASWRIEILRLLRKRSQQQLVPFSAYELAIERAQEILQDLRNRFSNPNRPRIELDYLERLMREIY